MSGRDEATATKWTINQRGEPNQKGNDWAYSVYRGNGECVGMVKVDLVRGHDGNPNLLIPQTVDVTNGRGKLDGGYVIVRSPDDLGLADRKAYDLVRAMVPEKPLELNDQTRHKA